MHLRTSPGMPILPAAPEHDWRLSYQFAPPRTGLLTRVVLGAGVLGLMIAVVNAAW
ncbi:MAG: hypothetical protein U0Y68_05640 [Blastocatellia bacterium]